MERRPHTIEEEDETVMTYAEAVHYLYTRTPLFSRQGATAYKPGLQTTRLLDDHFLHPHTLYHTIHVGGTNGKGSCASVLASILQEAGYRTGLYTSPHLTDFRERIRVQGEMISQERVVQFIEEERTFFEPLHPSFFEVTTALALLYFAEQHVDVAVIEVGLGGRLDATNIITPLISLITNISLDHTAQLGHTLPQIAREKAGIIKPCIPVVIGEATLDVREVFLQTARTLEAPIYFAQEEQPSRPLPPPDSACALGTYSHNLQEPIEQIMGPLSGPGQEANALTVLCAMPLLQERLPRIDVAAIHRGFANVLTNTHLRGRWQQLSNSPLTLCDIAHNPDGWQHVFRRLSAILNRQPSNAQLHIVFGTCADKYTPAAIALIPPRHTHLYCCAANTPRALPAHDLLCIALQGGLHATAYPSVAAAYAAAQNAAAPDDIIFIGGSNYVVAELKPS